MKPFFFFVFFLAFATDIHAQKGLKTLFAEHIFTATDGTQKSLADIIKSHEGKVIYIDFWASWCIPCRSEMPHSVTLYEKLKDKEIVFIYLSIDNADKETAWKNAMENFITI